MNTISRSMAALALLSGTVGAAHSMEMKGIEPAPSPHAIPTTLPGVYAFAQPPAEFDARTATPEDLSAWGYPPRPDLREGPEAFARWLEQVNPANRRSVPDLVVREGVYHRPATGLKMMSRPLGSNATNATSSNWSGFALIPTAGSQPLYWVTARWIVPTVKQAPRTCSGGWDYSSQWVGIGGFGDQYLLQAGSAANAFCDIGGNIPEYFPWLEWLPNAEMVLYKSAATQTLYPFAPGDYVIVTVWSPTASWNDGVSTSGNLSFSDVTQGWSVSLTFSAASVGGSQVTGQSAEWIVERTEVNGAFATLPDYVANPWWYATAGNLGLAYPTPGNPINATAYNITMLDDNNAKVSFVDLFGANSLWFFPEGSAVQ